jgi:hypothetical protein
MLTPQCAEKLSTIVGSVKKTLKWATQKQKFNRFLVVENDEQSQ